MNRKTWLLFLVIMLIAAFFRFWHLSLTPPGLYPDEAMNGNNAIEALKTGDWKVYYPENNGREGLMMNLQAISIYFLGNTPLALRLVGAIFGVLTVAGIFFLTLVLFFRNKYVDWIALAATFFLATSFWHINFSRMSFRAIMAPFFLIWGFYFFFKISKNIGSNASQILSALLGGILFGLGFYSYIAYRTAPLLLLIPIVAGYLNYKKDSEREACFPCHAALFLFFAFIAAIPIGLYYLGHPTDFFGRTSEISIFSAANTLGFLTENIVKTIGMFWIVGDLNWRHNFSGSPELYFPVGIFFLVGLIAIFSKLLGKKKSENTFEAFFLLMWIVLMLLPVVFSAEGIPHALRAIAAIPAVMIISAWGLVILCVRVREWLRRQKEKYPDETARLQRMGKEALILLYLIFAGIALHTFNNYFNVWAIRTETAASFSESYVEIGKALNQAPRDLAKYVIVNGQGVLVRSIPMPAQTIMYVTDSFLPENQNSKHIFYYTPDKIPYDEINRRDRAMVVIIDNDSALAKKIKQSIKGLKAEIINNNIFLVKNS